MGAQQVKEGRSGAVSSGTSGGGVGGGITGNVGGVVGGGGTSNIGGLTNNSTFGAGTSLRASRIKSRSTKDSKVSGSNIFTEHSGKCPFPFLLSYFIE